ncbi:MAG: sodium:proton antiporter [Candidatus Improbicoccus pseudotrichonymphae]|uniref:Sodium:proton antiporter n=1 Tax=Candidatus Improbicoccus pseudotrichonymphae TaxID=3033792 RepID=A0AA48KYF1_9FIRM|nr:MAG: sodium:proton antiporter [Candidatus Improbicoccus pseudotrichonymphae]
MFGFLSLLPPMTAVVLSLLTKEVIFSLFMGLILGVAVYSVGIGIGVFEALRMPFDLIAGSLSSNIFTIIFSFALGGLSRILLESGGSFAYAKYFKRKTKSKTLSQLFFVGLSFLFSIDDYFNCLATGAIMRPVTDGYKISRSKLAYILDATSAPLCVLMPISSWAAAIISCFKNSKINSMEVFLKTIPYNFYSVFTIVFLLFVILSSRDFGKMSVLEKSAREGNDMSSNLKNEEKTGNKYGNIFDLIIPILVLIFISVLLILETGGFFKNKNLGLVEVLSGANVSISIITGVFVALFSSLILTYVNRTLPFDRFVSYFVEGGKSIVSSQLLLTLVWSMSSLCKNYLMMDVYINSIMRSPKFSVSLYPFIFFIISSFLSFAIGSSWGTFGVLLPIVVSILSENNTEVMIYCCAAVLSGSIFGTHCSPISDNTVMAAAGANCKHMEHVASQTPYSYFVAIISSLGFLILGFTHNLIISMFFMLISMFLGFYVLTGKTNLKSKEEIIN